MDKKAILFFALVFGALGAYIPTLIGDTAIMSGWSILGGMIGGFFGIWAGVIVLKRWG